MTETTQNIEKYMTLVKALDPDLYEIKLALQETRVNPNIVIDLIKAVALLYYGSSHGKIRIIMNKGKIETILTEETTRVGQDAVTPVLMDTGE